MESLKLRYIDVCNDYAEAFSKITDKQGWWSNDYTLWITEYEAYTLDSIRYIVDNIKDLKKKYSDISKELNKWIEYNVFAEEYKINNINIKSWFAGAHRMSEAQINTVKDLKKALDTEINKYKKNNETHRFL